MTLGHRLAMSLVDVFENLLEEHHIVVPDHDREENNDTPLYGCTWANLVDDIEDTIVKFFSRIGGTEEIQNIFRCEFLDLNIAAFLEKFNQEYQFLYDNHDSVAGFLDALETGNQFMYDHPDFIAEFIRFRGEPITSDREVAAFMFALESMSE